MPIAWWRQAVAEFVGTFALIFIGAGAIIADEVTDGALGVTGIALAHGLAIATMVSALGAISGGHFNPAVTFGFLLTRRIAVDRAAIFLAAQLLGAIIAAALLKATTPVAAADAVELGTPVLATGVAPLTGIAIELVLTFFLVTAVFGTAVDSRGPRLGGFAIGLVITMDIFMGGPLTGAAMNPARAFGPALIQGLWDDQLVYWIGPLLGGGLAALVYEWALLPRAERPLPEFVR
jgi:aquaporin Z